MKLCKNPPSKLLWLDLETGGLDEDTQPIIEVAARATEGLFQTLSEFHRVIKTSNIVIIARSPSPRAVRGIGESIGESDRFLNSIHCIVSIQMMGLRHL